MPPDAPQAPQELQAVHDWHLPIDKHRIRHADRAAFDGLLAVLGLADLEIGLDLVTCHQRAEQRAARRHQVARGDLGTRHAPALHRGAPAPLREQLSAVLRNRAFRVLAGAIVVQLVAMSSMLATVPYVARYLLEGGESIVTLLFVCVVLPSLVAMPAWVALERRLGRIGAWTVATVAFAALNLSLMVAGPGRLWTVAGIVSLMGLAYGGTQVFPYALLPDAIAAGREDSGVEQGGVLAGVLTAAEKCGNALGALVAGLVLQASGFVESRGGVAVAQSAGALAGIRLGAAVLPALLLCASLPLLRRCRDAAGTGRDGAAARDGVRSATEVP